jgi:threonine/homoserine/homoserine lactone efflux protein
LGLKAFNKFVTHAGTLVTLGGFGVSFKGEKMSFEVWISFVLASMVLVFSPGPTVFLVIGQSLAFGRKSVLPLILGVITGDIIALSFSLLGVGAILSTSAFAFQIMKWAGALYLVYLGIKTWRSQELRSQVEIQSIGKPLKVYRDSLLVTALNPKGLIFFIAFFPLFLSPEASNIPQQLFVLALTFVFASAISVSFYAILGSNVRSYVTFPKIQKVCNRISGGMLFGAGLATSALKQ